MSDIDQLMAAFAEAEDKNYSLFNYVNEVGAAAPAAAAAVAADAAAAAAAAPAAAATVAAAAATAAAAAAINMVCYSPLTGHGLPHGEQVNDEVERLEDQISSIRAEMQAAAQQVRPVATPPHTHMHTAGGFGMRSAACGRAW
jgi:hypothetical protein